MRAFAILLFALSFSFGAPYNVYAAEDACRILHGAFVLADDGTYLGTIEDKYGSKSIFNRYGQYGNRYSADSIWNKYGQYGGKYSQYSPFNTYSSTPPLILKDGEVLAVLTVNKSAPGGIHPIAVAYTCYGYEDFFGEMP